MTPSRRDMFKLAVVACGARWLPACGSDASTAELVVPFSELPAAGVYASTGAGCGQAKGILIGRDAAGLYAYSDVCTHEGGHVPPPDATTGESKCCLHGSRFDRNGDLIEGIVPGQGSLPHYKLRIEGAGADAMVIVAIDQEEPDRDARVPVPG